MSFDKYREVIAEGDTVILYFNINSMYAIQVEPHKKNKNGQMVENIFQTTYGALRVASLLGAKFGHKVQLSRGWAYILHPTPELWTLTLPHRTQIIYSLDCSVIVHELELRPGSVVIESGTGSGSLSHSFIRTVRPTGHLYTFDFHSDRVTIAQKEFEHHGIGSFVTVQQRDVCKDGFGNDLIGKADAVFLDLPHPWDALSHVPKVFKDTGGRFGSFSPCIEQVQKTYEALKALGFVEARTVECLQKEYQVQHRNFPVVDLDGEEKVLEEDIDGVRQPFLGFLQTVSYKCGNFMDGSGPSGSGLSLGAIFEPEKEKGAENVRYVAGIPPATTPGHTGYLTFATFPPVWARHGSDDEGTSADW